MFHAIRVLRPFDQPPIAVRSRRRGGVLALVAVTLGLLVGGAAGAQHGTFVHEDPLGDLLGFGSVQHDITKVTAFASEASLFVDIQFSDTLRPGDSGFNDAISGALDVDTDRDPSTGATPFDADHGGSSGLGVDRWIPLGLTSISSSTVPVLDDTSSPVGEATVIFDDSANTLELQIPLSVLGSSDGKVDLSVVVATATETTDIAPNAGAITSLGNNEREFLGRFRVTANWRNRAGATGKGLWATSSLDSGVMWFFSPNNWEVLVKVLDGCAINGHFWVYFAATTDVEFTIDVVDLQTGVSRSYTNPLGQPANAVTDTAALATCGGQI